MVCPHNSSYSFYARKFIVDCLYIYQRCACGKNFDFCAFLLKIQIVELSHFCVNMAKRVYGLSAQLLQQFVSQEVFTLQNICTHIKDVHVVRILIFMNFTKKYRLLNLVFLLFVNLAERVHGLSVQLLVQFLCYDVFIFVECD